MSTNVPSKIYIRTNYICISINKGVVEFNFSKPSLTLWLSCNTSTSIVFEIAHESTYLPYQYTTMDPLPSPYENAIHSTHAYLAYFRVSTFHLSMNCTGNPEVLYHGQGYSNRSY